MYAGVPTAMPGVVSAVWVSASSPGCEASSCFAKPKSSTFTCPCTVSIRFDGFEIAMHDAAAMRFVQRLHDLVRALQQLARREAAFAGHAIQRPALDELHDDEAAALVLAHFVDLADEGVIERGGGQRLATQPLAGVRMVLHALRQHLDGDLALEDRVVRKVDLAHAALAHEALDAVAVREQAHLKRPPGGTRSANGTRPARYTSPDPPEPVGARRSWTPK